MKRLIAIILCLAMILALTGCSGSKKTGTLTIYTWAGMFPDEVIDAFEEETGITVNYQNFDTDENMLMTLEASKGADYDLVIADDYIIEQVISEGLAQKLDTVKISNWDNIDSRFQGQFYDSKDEYTVPYGAGIMQIAYNPDKVDIDIKGYADLFDDSLEGRVGVVGNNRVVTGLILKMLGYSMNTESEKEIREAGKKLIELSPNINLIKDEYLNEDLLAGTIDVALLYQSQATLTAIDENGANFKFVMPKEGLGFGVMGMFIPSQAANADAAHKFIDYILDGKVGASCFEWMGYCSTNSAANQYISDDFKDLLTLPANLDTENAEIVQNISAAAADVHEEIWNTFVNACK
ncbi:MAG: spermidine/putrescine ABC transporter substrate-binding protein [Clostridia bacterium]|nr:spermidine/putrescine ABC transporter substrate-binding protein [Clostridia bacterium]